MLKENKTFQFCVIFGDIFAYLGKYYELADAILHRTDSSSNGLTSAVRSRKAILSYSWWHTPIILSTREAEAVR